MKKIGAFLLLGISFLGMHAQQASLRGRIVDASGFFGVGGVLVSLEGSFVQTSSLDDGSFELSIENVGEEEQVINLSKSGYQTQRFPVNLQPGVIKDLDQILLEPDFRKEQLVTGSISLTDDELSREEGGFDNISGLLQASKDVFLSAVAYDFSQTFYKPRGIGSEYGKLLINGVEMNKFANGRPQWAEWGGLNDVQRNQVFTAGSMPSSENFGGLAGTTNIIMRASQFSKGSRVSLAASNRSYTGRLMATYNSGEVNNWYYSVSASRRFAEEGYIDGSLYDAGSVFASVEKKISTAHSLNFLAFYTPNIRGKSSPNTLEVTNMKGPRYNSYWGYQEGEIRNSRLREVKLPFFMLDHFWQVSEKTSLNTNLSYQFGKTANTRIDYGGTRLVGTDGQEAYVGGGSNPDPAYYQYLPSYFLRDPEDLDYEAAYLARESFLKNGQVDWQSLYQANFNGHGNSIYALSEDRSEEQNFNANAILNHRISKHLDLRLVASYRHSKSENFAAIRDLLGGEYFLDIDIFAEAGEDRPISEVAQSDLLHPNRRVTEGDAYKYHYRLTADQLEAYSMLQYRSSRTDVYTAIDVSSTSFQRTGLFKNGIYPENSLGPGTNLNFVDYGVKAGGTYKLTGRHLISSSLSFYTKAPAPANSYINPRQNNLVVENLDSERILSAEASYNFRSSRMNIRLSAYYIESRNATEVSYYYADGLAGMGRNNNTAFVQQVLTGIDSRRTGLELGVESQLTPTIKLKLVAAAGEFIYSNNPQLSLFSANFSEDADYGRTSLDKYHLANGPQQVGQFGFEYRDPDYWWFGATINYFSRIYTDINPLTRTRNFGLDSDGLPLLEYDESIARKLLTQEELPEYFLLNAVGGKSWRIKKNYLGFFVSLNNVLDKVYRTGGFEQARNANYRSLKEDRERDAPLFGNRYWFGNGATYYASLYLRF